jgi:hypothetical protein
MHMACFIDPNFNRSFLDYPKAAERGRGSDSDHPRRPSERIDQGLPVSATHSGRRGSTDVVEGPCIRAASPCQEAFLHLSNQRAISVQCQRAHCLPSQTTT